MAARSTLEGLKGDAAAGGLLVGSAALALILANSPARAPYFTFLAHSIPMQLGPWRETFSLREWTLQGLMTLFFFAAGLELKDQVRKGELSSVRRLVLPFASALGAMLGAAAACSLVTRAAGRPPNAVWAVALPSDAILSLAALAVAGSRAPAVVRPFLIAFGATSSLLTVAVVMLGFSRALDAEALAGAAAALCGLALLSRWRRAPPPLFAAGAVALWALILRSGLDPAAAGVAAGLMVPTAPRRLGERGLLDRARHALRPWIAFAVLPLFAFCVAGIPLGLDARPKLDLVTVVALTAAMIFGRAAGMIGGCAAAVRLGWARRPTGLTRRDLIAASLLCGGGFGLNLYVGARAFADPAAADGRAAATAAIAAGVLAVLAGSATLRGRRTTGDIHPR